MKKKEINNKFIKLTSFLLPITLIFLLVSIFSYNLLTISEITVTEYYESVIVSTDILPNWFNYINYLIFLLLLILVVSIFYNKINLNLPAKYALYYIGMWFYAIILLIILSNEPTIYLTSISAMSSKMAPGVIMAIGLFFLGAYPKVWSILKASLLFLILCAVCIWLFGLLQVDIVSRYLAKRWLWPPTLVLELLAILPFGIFYRVSSKYRILCLLPLLILLLSSIYQQTRLVFIMLAVQIVTYSFLRYRATRRHQKLRFNFGILSGIIFFVLLVVVFVSGEYIPQRGNIVSDSFISIMNRITEDSRSYQIEPFFEKLPEVFPWGSGYPVPGEYNAEGKLGIDSGFLSTMYVTGVPMVFCFIGMLVMPVLRILRLRLEPPDAAVAAGAFAYIVRLTSSTVPVIQVDFIVFVLLAGRCAYLVNRDRHVSHQFSSTIPLRKQ